MGDQKLAPRDKSNVARHRVIASKARKGKAINVEGKNLPKRRDELRNPKTQNPKPKTDSEDLTSPGPILSNLSI